MRFKRLFNKGVFFKAVSGTVYHAGQRCLTDSDKSSTTVTSPHLPLLSETGRSMIEMLGVLAIIGVLSIAAVAGYRFALLKFRANEVTNELNMRAINVSAQMLNTGTVYEKNELIEDGFGDTLTVGFPVETAISDRNTDYFEILVSDIPADLCRQILRDYENPIMIFVNNVRYNADTTICDDETQNALNDMGFIYKNDLGTHEACSEKGYFGEEDFQCHCSGNTYLDIYTNDCLCPAGHVWSAGEGTCIESICPEGQFESLKNGCVPCSDEKTYTIATDERHKQLCEASTCGRIVVGSNCLKNKCQENEFIDNYGNCYPCGQNMQYHVSITEAVASCTSCRDENNTPNMLHLPSGGWCVNKNWCPTGQKFYWHGSGSAYLQCAACSGNQVVEISTSESVANASQCNDCRDADGNQSRILVKKGSIYYCYPTQCIDTQFKGANGACYACDTTDGVYVGKDEVLRAGCLTCGREISEDDICQVGCQQGEGLRLKDGTCYPCDYWKRGATLKLTELAEGVSCDACSTRVENGSYCVSKTACVDGFMDSTGAYCYGCSETGIRPVVGTGTFTAQQCEACGHHVVNGLCIRSNCTTDQFWAAEYNNTCYACSLVDAIKIGTHEIERNQCRACITTPRFWAGSYCYRCDSAETPDVTTAEEEVSCNSCAEREVKDGKCILVQ